MDSMHNIVNVLRSGEWLTGHRLKSYIVCFVIAYGMAIGWVVFNSTNLVHHSGILLGGDFASFWNAGRLAVQGDAVTVYDHDAFVKAQLAANPVYYVFFFFYPPHYLLALMPIGLLAYPPAYLAFMGSTFAAAASALFAIRPNRWTVLGAVAAPVFVMTLFFGQNAFLTGAFLAAGLLLVDKRPVLAGVAIGALTIKPQLGLLIPLAFVCGGYWRTIFSAAVSTGVMLGAAYLVLGAGVFAAFLANSGSAMHTLRTGAVDWEKMISVYAGVRMAGGSDMAGWLVQVLVSGAMVLLTGYVWLKSRPSQYDMRNAILVVSALLVTPFALIYDMFLLTLPVVWIVSAGERDGFRSWEITSLAVIGVAPLIAVAVAFSHGIPLAPLLMMALLGLTVARWQALAV